MKDRRLLLGLLSPIISFSFIGLAIAIHPWFSWTENALSDLGAPGVEEAWVFDLALILGGISAFLFSTYLLGASHNTAEKLAASIFMISTICMALIGVFAEGHPLHFPSAVLFYLLSFISMFLYGIAFFRTEKIFSAIFLLLPILAFSLMALPIWTSLAIPETIGAAAISLWVYLMVYGIEKREDYDGPPHD
jgi:hypothetical membrane protein